MGDKDLIGKAHKCNMTNLEEIKVPSNYNKANKVYAFILVSFALCLSFALLGVGFWTYCNSKPSEPTLKNKTETKYNTQKDAGTICCRYQKEEVASPASVTEYCYDNTSRILLYGCILVFMFFSLWGAFTFLLKVLKSEHEVKSKVLDVELYLYKEQKMRKITSSENK